jgi:hypothetical protein
MNPENAFKLEEELRLTNQLMKHLMIKVEK